MKNNLLNSKLWQYRSSLRSIGQKGFTLVELLVVLTLIGILATMAITSISDFKDLTRISRAVAEISGLEKDIISYATEKGVFPPDNVQHDLSAVRPGGQLDPWGQPYIYRLTRVRKFITDDLNSDFDLYSCGPDRQSSHDSISGPPNDDDIVRGRDGGYIGTALKYAL